MESVALLFGKRHRQVFFNKDPRAENKFRAFLPELMFVNETCVTNFYRIRFMSVPTN